MLFAKFRLQFMSAKLVEKIMAVFEVFSLYFVAVGVDLFINRLLNVV